MGLLDSLIGGALQGGLGGVLGGSPASATGGGSQTALLNAILGMLANGSAQGGLGGLVSKFQQSGLDDVIASWISSGQNRPISPDQLRGALGDDTLGRLAQQAGLPSNDVLGPLAELLPQVVDRLTPQGQMPQGGLGNLSDLLGMLARR
ncbi:MAG: DUF937 domain-containing protein [Burkholderiaceae bacterium]|jgi:uncharacterized protein YidB (DUF937 family)|nr:DUF937 domain-containing protein [Burkholderiaceae bacterium]